MTDSPSSSPSDIAIVGMACRVPGAATYDALWRLLAEGREGRTTLTDDDLKAAGVPASVAAHPDYVKAGMFLDGMEQFDPGFFGFSPLDGRILDPQHRHFLECAWEAMEDAGCDPARESGAIGVFAGSGQHSYLAHHLLGNPTLVEEVGHFLLRHTGNDKDFLATRASYCFDLKGPSINVQTACSTSLVAIHLAVQSLLNGECDMALAGGVTIDLPHRVGYLYKESEILSRDGHCRPFDASSGGTVFGSGVGVVVLKRLDEAIRDRDHVHAVIKASAVNNDGSAKVSYLAPSVDGQAEAITEALVLSGADAGSVSYIETHGTGTQLGDPIEVAALTQAYGSHGAARRQCGLGSIKSNIGHLDTAAGVASLIKVVMAMQQRQLPATLHHTAPNPAIDFDQTPFFVVDSLRPWQQPPPLRAGVSSLGVGGTNAHLIVEEAPNRVPGDSGRALQLLVMSARSDQALMHARQRLAGRLEEPGADAPGFLADTAFTLAVGRRAFRRRGFLVAGSARDAADVLCDPTSDRFAVVEAPAAPRRVAFMFAGGGAQYPGMGQGLYDTEPIYRATVDECLRLLTGVIDYDLKALLLPATPADRDAAAKALERPSRTLPALFVTQYAQARLWQAWGVEPDALVGHSMGENTAACLAGVFSLHDALGLVALRGRLFERIPSGGMLSVALDETALAPHLGADLSIAAVNAPGSTVVSGPAASVAELERTLTQREVGCQRVRIDVAAHSVMLEPILEEFRAYLRSIPLQTPQLPFLSNLTGTWIDAADAVSPDYWVRHLRHTVRFADGIGTLLGTGPYVLLEVGPGRTLTSLASLHPATASDQALVTSLRHPDDSTPDQAHMLGALGRLWQSGATTDWTRFYEGQTRARVPLPAYAFDHVTCWVERPVTRRSAEGEGHAGRPATDAEWLYQAVWQRTVGLPPPVLTGARVLLMAPADEFSGLLQTALAQHGASVRLATPGDHLRVDGSGPFAFRLDVADDYLRMTDACDAAGWTPTHVLHTLALGVGAGLTADRLEQDRALTFDSLLLLAQAAGVNGWSSLCWLTLARQAWQTAGEPVHSPLGALGLGPVNTFPREFPAWRARLLDVASPVSVSAAFADRVVAELADAPTTIDGEALVALRGAGRFVQRMVRRTEPLTEAPPVVAHVAGTYVVTGGTGGLGLVAAEMLARQATPVTLVLVSRNAWPDRVHWDELIERGAPEAGTLEHLKRLEALGAQVRLEAADVGREDAVRALAARLSRDGLVVRGILHAAGVTDDAPLVTKELSQARAVLAPKVDGTAILSRVFTPQSLDFFALFSSSSAFAGLPGQVDYTAANAFLDSFAHWAVDAGWPCLGVNWPAWRDTGLAATLASGTARRRLPAGRPTAHPMLDRCVAESDAGRTFVTAFSPREHWVLAEHRLKDGPALMPGFGFLEMARAAWTEGTAMAAVEMADVSFDFPFIVSDDALKPLSISLETQSDGASFVLASTEGDVRTEHARGTIRRGASPGAPLDVEAVRKRCIRGRQRFDDADHHPYLAFGPRWAALQTVDYAGREALITLDLAPGFAEDLAAFKLHPALADMAAAGAQVIIDGYAATEEVFVPVGCRRLRFSGEFPARATSHVVFKPGQGDHHREIALFDVRVADDAGTVFLEIDDFSMRRLPNTDALRRTQAPAAAGQSPALTRALELGIAPAEGARVLAQVLGHRLGPQTVVAPCHPASLVRELRLAAAPPVVEAPPAFDPDDDPAIPGVEGIMAQCPAIAQVVVRSFKDGANRRLVAFFRPDDEHFVTQSEIRRYARAHLAADAAPQQFVELDELATTAGAVDRSALPDPLAPVDHSIPPRTTTEKAIARIWQDALGVDRIGITDNFFDLGGHSLLSARVIVQVERKLGVRLSQATMVMGTVEQIANDIESRGKGTGS